MTQFEFSLPSLPRGYHIITDFVKQALGDLPDVGVLHLFIKHTSAGLLINEGADPSVLNDLNVFFDKLVKEDEPYYTHIYEGSDDMPAHIKSALTNNQISLSVRNAELLLGTWQGLYLFEHRIDPQNRSIIHHFIGD